MAVGASLFGFAGVVGAQSPPAPSPTTNGRRPAGMKDDEAVVFDFCSVLLHPQHFVDDALFRRAVSVLGERGMVDLIGVRGYYTLVSMIPNVAEVPLPAGAASPW